MLGNLKTTMATKYTLDGQNTGLALTAPVDRSNLPAQNRVNSAGRVSTTALSRKAWVEDTGSALKGRALKRAHNEYLRQYADTASGEVAKALASGQIGIIGIAANKSGASGSFKWVHRGSIVDPVADTIAKAKREKCDAVRAALVAAGASEAAIEGALAALAK